ncbi:hypothetical protein EGI22_02080 [Lacihabitans sp. LS3-19]|uniref:hypothetical protein n=1 Tax=Lacihabitans sp. LS3-19 TaxID=2487335 RepID=UPI0020CD9FC7|nr:hypothetical protein [Lacihabitans sp. LS3-19]MCP9766679.1 hypothetical protein [Lacihabitans sp. LS3-19]
MMKYLFGILMIATTISCSKITNENFSEELIKLEDNQAKISININQKNFYEGQETFTGSGFASNDNGVKISLKNQFFGNIIVSLEGNLNIEKMPLKLTFKNGFPEGSTSGSFLIGKITDASKNAGEGYILTDGGFEIIQLDSSAIIIKVKGQLRKPFGDSGLSTIDGNIVWKKPEVSINKNSIKE